LCMLGGTHTHPKNDAEVMYRSRAVRQSVSPLEFPSAAATPEGRGEGGGVWAHLARRPSKRNPRTMNGNRFARQSGSRLKPLCLTIHTAAVIFV